MHALVLCRYTEERTSRDADAIASGSMAMNNRALTPNSASSPNLGKSERQMRIVFNLLHYNLIVQCT